MIGVLIHDKSLFPVCPFVDCLLIKRARPKFQHTSSVLPFCFPYLGRVLVMIKFSMSLKHDAYLKETPSIHDPNASTTGQVELG